jgi:hypothetical protein
MPCRLQLLRSQMQFKLQARPGLHDNYPTALQNLCCCTHVNCLQIRVLSVGTELTELATGRVELDSSIKVESLAWSPQGQILAAATSTGVIHCFLGVVPLVSAVHMGRIVHMTSLTEASIYTPAQPGVRASIALAATPHFMALNSSLLICSVNNCAYFHSLDQPLLPPRVREYPGGTIEGMQATNSHLALLMDCRVVVHMIESDSELLVPHKERDVADFALTDVFLIIGTTKGQLQHYKLGDGVLEPLNQYRHSKLDKPVAIERIWAPSMSTHIIFSDAAGSSFVFSPIDDQVQSQQQTASKESRLPEARGLHGFILVHSV